MVCENDLQMAEMCRPDSNNNNDTNNEELIL